ncbi:hypothetical protein EVAR_96893_1 [Eumeta japonica]|uniref:Uncharacterized protein n=1 Tax=Eumeta variegata TaxID=151549 RepID=A0A4C1WEL7_EUMVA|nr:hypothetical protein EVAR_96893_1 [Eumeta japonica]
MDLTPSGLVQYEEENAKDHRHPCVNYVRGQRLNIFYESDCFNVSPIILGRHTKQPSAADFHMDTHNAVARVDEVSTDLSISTNWQGLTGKKVRPGMEMYLAAINQHVTGASEAP